MTDQAKLEAALYAANETIRLKDARIAELEAENERLKSELRWEVEWCCPYKRQVDRLRIQVERAEKALSSLEALDD